MNNGENLFTERGKNCTELFSSPFEPVDDLIYGVLSIEERQKSESFDEIVL